MKKVLTRAGFALTVVSVVATILAPSTAGATTKPRTAVVPYSRVVETELDVWIALCGASGFYGGALGTGNSWGTADFWPESGEKSVTISVVDALPGQRVMALVQYVDPHGAPASTVVCGSTERALRIDADQSVSAWVLEGTSDQGPSMPTSGRVVATFYR